MSREKNTRKLISGILAIVFIMSIMFGCGIMNVFAGVAATITINCASNDGAVNTFAWGVGAPDKYSWWAGNAGLKQRISDAKIKLVRVGPVQAGKYNNRDMYPSHNNWNWLDMDALLNTVWDAGAQPLFIVCGYPAGVLAKDWNEYAYFMEGVVERYNVQKVLGATKTIKYFEMWNEPTIEGDGILTQTDYKSFIQTVGARMKAKDSTIKLLGPADAWSDLSSSGWCSYVAKNLESQIDILSWHDYGPAPDGNDSGRMDWTKPHYQDNIVTAKAGGISGSLTGPTGKLYGAAITEYNMSHQDGGVTYNLKYHNEFDAVYAASSIINAMKGKADIFTFYNLSETGGNLLGLLNNTDYSAYKPYYTFFMFGNCFLGNQMLTGSGGTTKLEYVASKNTSTGKYYMIVSNKDTSTRYDITINLNGISPVNGGLKVWKLDAATNPTSYTSTGYWNSMITYTIQPLSVLAFEVDPAAGTQPTPTPKTPITAPSGTNICLNRPITATGYNSGAEVPGNGVDGNTGTKWCDTTAGNKWLRVDLGEKYYVGRWVVKHAGAGGESTSYNTSDFKLQSSNDDITWTDVDSVTGNTQNITDRTVTTFAAEYLRLYITKGASSDNIARIYEFEAYSPNGTGPTPTPTPGGPILSGQIYKLTCKVSNKVAEVAGSSTLDGANIQQMTWNGGSNQLWRFDDMGGGNYKITAQNSGKSMEVAGSSTSDGGNVQQMTDNGGNNQRWIVTDMGGGYYRIANKNSGKVLDVNASSGADGANIQQWTDNGSDAQRWKIEPVSGATPTPTSTSTLAQSPTPTPISTPTPTATSTPTPGGALFQSGLETGDTQPTWIDTLDGSQNVGAFTGDTIPRCNVSTAVFHAGSKSLMYSGKDNSASTSYCKYKVFDVNISIVSTTEMSFWIYPTSDNARYCSIDYYCTDGSSLRDSTATDYNGYGMHPNQGHGGNIPLNAWTQIKCNVGQWLNGKTIDRIQVNYDRPANTGDYRGYIDDIVITNGTLP